MHHSAASIQPWTGVKSALAQRQRANISSRASLEAASRFFACANTEGEACAGVPDRKGGANYSAVRSTLAKSMGLGRKVK
jgi:hypothetical protein